MANLDERFRYWTAFALRITVALGLVASAACSEEVDREVSGRWLDVTLPADVEICAGTLPGYDRFVESVADRWGFELAGWRGQMEVASPGDPGACSIPGGSCAYPHRQEVWLAGTSAGEHELVHLIASNQGPRPPFFSEGIATHWGSRPFSKYTVAPELIVPLLESQTPTELLEVWNLGYNAAGGFTGRLIEEYGVERYRRFYEDLPRDASVAEIGGVFEEVFGEPLEPQLARLSTDPVCNQPIWACEHAIPTTLPIVQDGPLDCDDPNVQGFDSEVLEVHAPKQALLFTLDEDTNIEFSLRNVDLVMTRCGDCSDAEIQTGAFMDGPRVYSDRLPAGTWSVRISNRSSEDMYFGLRVLEE